jgi:hypothetical protein
MTVFRCAAVVALALLGHPAPGQTPQTRAEAIRLERVAKQGRLTPYKHNGLESALHIVEDRLVPFLARDGLYARLGGVAAGGGTAFGIGFRDRSLARRRGSVDLWAAGSLTKYWAVEGRADYPLVPGDWLSIEAYGRRYEYPSEDFFGTGPDTSRQDFTVFNIHGSVFGARLDVRPRGPLSFGGGVEYQKPRIAPGKERGLPTIGSLFDDRAAPALISQPDFVRPWGFVEIDYRRPKNAKQGGYYRAEFSQYNDQDGRAFTFSRFDLDLRQFVSFLGERRTLAGRVVLSTTDVEAGRRVPFYLMPSLGGQNSLRGFHMRRFVGPHAILLQAEYRWDIWSALEAALFYDAGKVTWDRSDLNLKNLEHDFGFGFRFNTSESVIFRVDAAFGSRDGANLHVVFGSLF